MTRDPDSAVAGWLERFVAGPLGTLRLAAVAAALTLALFAVTLDADTFGRSDDDILHIPLVAHVRNVPKIMTTSFIVYTDAQYRPLPYVLLALGRTVASPESAVFWHLWMLAFHVLNAMLVYAVARHFSRKLVPALLAMAVYLCHPIASGFGNRVDMFPTVLGATLTLGATACLLRFARTRRPALYLGALALFVAGLLTSTVVLMLVPLVFLCELLYERTHVLKALAVAVPFVALAAGFWWATAGVQPHPNFYVTPPTAFGDARWYWTFGFTGGGADALTGLLAGRSTPVPIGRMAGDMHQPWNPRFIITTVVLLMALAAALAAMWWKSWLFAGLYLLWVGMLPRFGLAQNLTSDYTAWSDRCLPLAGFALTLAAAVALVMRRLPRRARWTAPAVVGLAVVLGATLLVDANFHARTPEDYWQHVLARNPRSETASVALGKVYLARDDRERAFRYLFGPTVRNVRSSCLAMTRYYARRGDPLAAAAHFDAACRNGEYGRQFHEHMLTQAEIFRYMQAYDFAESCYGYVLMVDSSHVPALRGLADVMQRKGYLPAAVKMIDRAARVDPNDPDVAGERRALHRRLDYPEQCDEPETIVLPDLELLRFASYQGSSPRIQRELARLTRNYPDDPIIQLAAAMAVGEMGDYHKAIARTDVAVARMPASVSAQVARCWLIANAVRDARKEEDRSRYEALFIATLDAVGPLYIRDGENWGTLGHQCAGDGLNDLALRAYQLALRANPEMIEGYVNAGTLLLRLGRPEEALPCFEKALAMEPEERERVELRLATALMRLKRYPDAIEHFRAAVTLEPSLPVAYIYMAMAFAELERYDRSVAALEEGMTVVLKSRGLKRELAKYLSAAPDDAVRDGRRAIALIEKTCDRSDATPQEYDILAAAYAETGQFRIATATAVTAARLARDAGLAQLARQIDGRRRLYERDERFRIGRRPSR